MRAHIAGLLNNIGENNKHMEEIQIKHLRAKLRFYLHLYPKYTCCKKKDITAYVNILGEYELATSVECIEAKVKKDVYFQKMAEFAGRTPLKKIAQLQRSVAEMTHALSIAASFHEIEDLSKLPTSVEDHPTSPHVWKLIDHFQDIHIVESRRIAAGDEVPPTHNHEDCHKQNTLHSERIPLLSSPKT